MLEQGNTVSNIHLSDEDYAAKLIRIPPHLKTQTKHGAATFNETLKRTMDGSAALQTRAPARDTKLMDVCIEMESLFVARMLKEMRKTIHKTDWLNGGFAEEIFEDMLYDEYALSLSKNSNLGLAKMLYDELKRKG